MLAAVEDEWARHGRTDGLPKGVMKCVVGSDHHDGVRLLCLHVACSKAVVAALSPSANFAKGHEGC